MTKQDLVNQVASEVGKPKAQVETIINATFEAISDALEKGEKVTLIGFGTFEVTERSARQGINPQTGQKMLIPAKKVPKFKPGKALKERVG